LSSGARRFAILNWPKLWLVSVTESKRHFGRKASRDFRWRTDWGQLPIVSPRYRRRSCAGPRCLRIGGDPGGNREDDVEIAVQQKIGLTPTFETTPVVATVLTMRRPSGEGKNDNFAILAPSQCGYFFHGARVSRSSGKCWSNSLMIV